MLCFRYFKVIKGSFHCPASLRYSTYLCVVTWSAKDIWYVDMLWIAEQRSGGEGRQRESYRYCGLIYYLSIDILSYYDIQNTIYIDIILKTDYNSIYYLPLQADDCEGWVAIHILQANEKLSYFYQSQKKVLKKQDGDDTWRENFPTKWKWMQKTCKFILRSGNCKEYLYNFKVYMN